MNCGSSLETKAGWIGFTTFVDIPKKNKRKGSPLELFAYLTEPSLASRYSIMSRQCLQKQAVPSMEHFMRFPEIDISYSGAVEESTALTVVVGRRIDNGHCIRTPPIRTGSTIAFSMTDGNKSTRLLSVSNKLYNVAFEERVYDSAAHQSVVGQARGVGSFR